MAMYKPLHLITYKISQERDILYVIKYGSLCIAIHIIYVSIYKLISYLFIEYKYIYIYTVLEWIMDRWKISQDGKRPAIYII